MLSHAGVPIELVGDVLGHDGVRMTTSVYRHSVVPVVKAAASAMDQIFKAASNDS